ncbi:hypothetical protein L227DRAFT_69524 [Lentinus tigrinus ALCF2SS1-6]|uniref:Uncharacterized protein n=1 Tax=Lentinus tigrinus ALCF2SS1-6 TaxID=1328759 RepID=A0A5C2SE35_9APHY|nr:hypothetical protein L227DRAFT_69524 [Lentinus tigrinus ALCF2SS1-6]
MSSRSFTMTPSSSNSPESTNTPAILIGVFVAVAVVFLLAVVVIAARNRMRSPYERHATRSVGPFCGHRTWQ